MAVHNLAHLREATVDLTALCLIFFRQNNVAAGQWTSVICEQRNLRWEQLYALPLTVPRL